MPGPISMRRRGSRLLRAALGKSWPKARSSSPARRTASRACCLSMPAPTAMKAAAAGCGGSGDVEGGAWSVLGPGRQPHRHAPDRDRLGSATHGAFFVATEILDDEAWILAAAAHRHDQVVADNQRDAGLAGQSLQAAGDIHR